MRVKQLNPFPVPNMLDWVYLGDLRTSLPLRRVPHNPAIIPQMRMRDALVPVLVGTIALASTSGWPCLPLSPAAVVGHAVKPWLAALSTAKEEPAYRLGLGSHAG